MQMFFPGELTSLNVAQKNSPFLSIAGGEEGEGQAFQLLFESMLFQTVAKELFQGKNGLLAGVGLGLFEEGQETNGQLGDNFLALLELLQIPLMEQLRPVQGEINNGETLLNSLLANGENGNANSMSDLLSEWQQIQEELNLLEMGQKTQTGSLSNLNITEKEEQIPLLNINQNIETEQKAELKLELFSAKNNDGKGEGFLQGQGWQNVQGAEITGGIARPPSEANLPEKISYQIISDQIIQSGKLKLLGEKREIEIQLKPEYLGRLALKVTAENGILTARFLVDNYQVSRMLDQNLTNVRQILADQGINLDQVQVEVGDPRSSFQEQQKEWSGQRNGKETKPGLFEATEILEEGLNPQDLLAKIGIDYRA